MAKHKKEKQPIVLTERGELVVTILGFIVLAVAFYGFCISMALIGQKLGY